MSQWNTWKLLNKIIFQIPQEPRTQLFLLPFFSLPAMLCDPIGFIWEVRDLFEAMTDHTAFINYLLAEVFRDFLQLIISPGCNSMPLVLITIVKKINYKSMAYSSQWSHTVQLRLLQPSGSWRHNGIMWLALWSAKSINIYVVNPIRYFLIK